MSNSEFFLVKEDKDEIEFNIPRFKFQDGIVLQVHQEQKNKKKQGGGGGEEFHDMIILQGHQYTEIEQEEEEEEFRHKESSAESTGQLSIGEFKATEDNDDDGFKTPNSLVHKIPVIKQCPPAPRKPKPLLSTKRKTSRPNLRRNLQLHQSREVESLLFPRPILADFYQKIKKARRDD